MLLKDVAIHFIRQDNGNYPFLELVSGAECLGSDAGEKCFVPCQGWHVPEPVEVEALSSDIHEISDVYLLSLPEDRMKDIREEITRTISSQDYQKQLRPLIERFSRSAVSWLNSLSLPFRYSYLGADLALAPPGLRSTAFDRVKRSYKGLHIDDHEKLSYDKRNNAFILFSINLGTAIRYFQVVNLQVATIIRLLKKQYRDEPIESRPARELKDLFLDRYPTYPVIRAGLCPGNAYLGQTQNVIHDGATNKQGVTDMSLQIALKANLP